jgi:hypothetical protein
VIDGQLLPPSADSQPYPEMVTVLRNSLDWLMGNSERLRGVKGGRSRRKT